MPSLPEDAVALRGPPWKAETVLVVMRWVTIILFEPVTRYLFWFVSAFQSVHCVSLCACVCRKFSSACVCRKFSSACLCLGVWNITDVIASTNFYAFRRWRRWGGLTWRLFGFQIRPKKKVLHSYKKVQEGKSPRRVQRDLSLIRGKNNSYSLRNPLGVRGSWALGMEASKPLHYSLCVCNKLSKKLTV